MAEAVRWAARGARVNTIMDGGVTASYFFGELAG